MVAATCINNNIVSLLRAESIIFVIGKQHEKNFDR
jgi:hypothetical protein